MFNAGAQIALPATTSLLDLAYDDLTDKWTAIQAGYESSWQGLVRVTAAAPSAGAFSGAVTRGDRRLLARSGTTPGVDITAPAIRMRTEFAKRLGVQNLRPARFDFDATASQTDFALPVGYTASEVHLSGQQVREGTSKTWVRVFDGFVETVRFNAAQSAGVWVQIYATKELT